MDEPVAFFFGKRLPARFPPRSSASESDCEKGNPGAGLNGFICCISPVRPSGLRIAGLGNVRVLDWYGSCGSGRPFSSVP